MSRDRFAVVMNVPEPWAAEIEGLRRALGDTQLARIGPHVTLVPPGNADPDELEELLAAVRGAAAATSGPLDLRVGPVASFLPGNPVLYLEVSPVEPLDALATACLVGPFDRPRRQDFVPHVTIDIAADSERIPAAVELLAGWEQQATFDRVGVMRLRRDDRGRERWVRHADAVFGGASSVDVGSLTLELSESTLVAPSDADRLGLDPEPLLGRGAGDGLVVTARTPTDARVVGIAAGRRRGRRASVLRNVFVALDDRGQGVARRLVEAWERAAERGGARRIVAPGVDDDVAGLLAHLGWGHTDPILDRRFG